MGFGQYAGHGRGLRDAGWKDGAPLKVGRMTQADVLAKVKDGYLSYRKSGHNESTRRHEDGTEIVRLRETDILTIIPEDERGQMVLYVNTGGWNTVTTRQHLMGAIHRYIKPDGLSIWGQRIRRNGKTVSANIIRRAGEDFRFLHRCKIVVNRIEGGRQYEFMSDLTDSPLLKLAADPSLDPARTYDQRVRAFEQNERDNAKAA